MSQVALADVVYQEHSRREHPPASLYLKAPPPDEDSEGPAVRGRQALTPWLGPQAFLRYVNMWSWTALLLGHSVDPEAWTRRVAQRG